MSTQSITAGGNGNRVSLERIPEKLELPDLIEVQSSSYNRFLQLTVSPDRREEIGLQEVLRDVFPIKSQDGLASLDVVSYSLGPCKYNIEECQKRGLTYAAPLKAVLRLEVFEKGQSGQKPQLVSMQEQEVFLGELPLMTPKGTFVINGAERVVVSQMHKSPGVSFEHKNHPSGRKLLMARVIPYRGAWLEFEYDINDYLFMTIDRRSRLLATVMLRALGYETDEEILRLFYTIDDVEIKKTRAVVAGETVPIEQLKGLIVAADIVETTSGEVVVEAKTVVTDEILAELRTRNLKKFKVLHLDSPAQDISIVETLRRDYTMSRDEALVEIYRRMRPGEPANINTARNMFERLFFDPARYFFASVGRYKINRKLNLDIPMEVQTLTREDVVATLRYLVKLRNKEGVLDDIDHLGNRRVRSVGELLANQVRIGLVRMERTIRDRMNYQDIAGQTPQTLVNPKPVSTAIRDFFGRSQLSHFMDQTNPLAELRHRRRLSALGPGGLNRDRATFEVRDVHPTHYGRICPIETPEGPNIGLMASLSTYARVNEYGFIETPYWKVKKGRVTDELAYLSAYQEDNYIIAQANAPVDEKGRFTGERVLARYQGNFPLVRPEQVDYVDVSPKQLVSVSAALIPFLEHDDANRALMGSNMQSQAVPLLVPRSPIVGTGMEGVTARNSGALVIAAHDGVVESVDAEQIVVRHTGRKTKNSDPFSEDYDVYNLRKFARSNQNTTVNQRPLVEEGQRVKKGDVLADGAATDGGELALGRNVLVAFMPWEGYNFEDAILISDKIVKEDVLTSVHVEVFDIEARDTKLGREEITRDIPNVGEEALKNLDENGIVRIGAEVKSGDILVGKVTPKTETELAPEEKLLRAIFGDKAEDVRDASLVVPPGVNGIVVDVRVFSRKDRQSDKESQAALRRQVSELRKGYDAAIERIRKRLAELGRDVIVGQKIAETVTDAKGEVIFKAKNKVLRRHLTDAPIDALVALQVDDKKAEKRFNDLAVAAQAHIEQIEAERDTQIDLLRKGDELPPGVNKHVQVFVATKRKISVGDKVAGRHGNKGVVAKILPEEDMPFLPDGTSVEIVLNPLGVPSRMNVGQILETHLGWAGHALGLKFASPVFNGATEEQIRSYMREAGLPVHGKTVLRDGRTGIPFDQEATVGYIYVLKLAHMVDDKIHARAIGPYSLVTQQPLGGKAQFGGQRFGEMEVWSLEAYGAAHTLQELLTVKSDDVQGRTKAYEAIVKGEKEIEIGTPESFNVLIKELQSLCLNITKWKKIEEEGDDNGSGPKEG